MSATRRSHWLKVGSILVSTLLAASTPQVSNAGILFDRELLSENINIEPEDAVANDSHDVALVEVLHNLNNAGLLTEETYNRTIREVEQGIIRVRSQLASKLVEQNSTHTYTLFAVPDINDLSEIQHILEPLNNELEQLNNTGILSTSVYEYLQSELSSGRLFHKLQLYQTAQIQLEREESVDPDLLKPRLDEIRAADIISEQGYISLLEALEASALQNPIEFLNYIDQAQMFDLTDYSLDPELYFPAIYQSVAQMLTRTGIVSSELSEFDLELVLDQIYKFDRADTPELVEEEWRTYDAVVSAQIDDRSYAQSSYYSPPSDEQDFLGRIESDGLASLFNKVLRDQSSPYRLFSIASFTPHVDYSRFGIIALTEAQADVYWGGSWHETDYTNTFTSDRIAEIVTLFKNIELFTHLSTRELIAGEQRIARQYITEPYQLLSAFKDVILLFDWESAAGDTPYKHLLESLSDISRGSFEPTHINDNFDWESQTASIAFTLNGTRYSADLEFNRDWLDPRFFEFVESVAAEEVLTGKFYPLSENGYGPDGYIFLNDEQWEVLRSQQIITSSTD
ncbi:MAG: hypothetical protein ACFB0D_08885 [Phormidesmis sp.]